MAKVAFWFISLFAVHCLLAASASSVGTPSADTVAAPSASQMGADIPRQQQKVRQQPRQQEYTVNKFQRIAKMLPIAPFLQRAAEYYAKYPVPVNAVLAGYLACQAVIWFTWLIGYTREGVRPRSFAALLMQSRNGYVRRGSLIALFQSIGAGGLGRLRSAKLFATAACCYLVCTAASKAWMR